MSPEIGFGARSDIVFRAAVPEAAVNENGDSGAREYNIRPRAFDAVMELVAQSVAPEHLPQGELRARILAADAGHQGAAIECHSNKLRFPGRARSEILKRSGCPRSNTQLYNLRSLAPLLGSPENPRYMFCELYAQ